MQIYALPITLTHISGKTVIITNPDELHDIKFVTHHAVHINRFAFSKRFGFEIWTGTTLQHVGDWIARDHEGRIVEPADFPRVYRRRRRVSDVIIAMERGLPIPGTGRSHWTSRYRRSSTARRQMSEDVALTSDLAEHGIHVNHVTSRHNRHLSAWNEDFRRTRRTRECNWKSFRTRQWK